jgi:L-ascorbate metabolism protein UlaG (beta-lactamase superfamily)
MKVTKYEHACFTVEIDNQLLVVDPGNFTASFEIPTNVVAIVITHEHPDHFDPDVLAAIYNKNPESVLISLAAITQKMPDHKSQIIKTGDKVTARGFELEFFGGKHAQIHSSIPIIDNVGVMINNTLYYPGDSFAAPNRPVDTLALPASGPWFKTSDAVDFLLTVKPNRAFPTHNVHNSEPGQELFNKIVGGFANQSDIDYIPLAIKQTIEI